MTKRKISISQIKTIQYIERSLEISSIFRKYRRLPRELSYFSFGAINSNYLKKCFLKNSTIFKDPIKDSFYKNISEKCLVNFMDKYNYIDLEKSIPLLLTNLDLITNSKYRLSFSNFLIKLPTKNSTGKQFLKAIRNYYIQKEKKPYSKILPLLPLNSKLTSYIQKNSFLKNINKKYFFKELKNLTVKLENSYLNGEYQRGNNIARKIVIFYKNNKSFLEYRKTWILLHNLGIKLVEKNEFHYALKVFEIAEEMASKKEKLVSLFRGFLTFFLKEDFIGAQNYIQRKNLLLGSASKSDKFRYWIARVYENNKEHRAAKEIYQEMIQENPLSFYSILSLERLQKFHPSYDRELLVTKRLPASNQKLKYSFKGHIWIRRLDYFSRVSETNLINITSRFLLSQPPETIYQITKNQRSQGQELLIDLIIKKLSKRNQHLEAFKFAFKNINNKGLLLNRAILKSLFPKRYFRKIKKEASRIDPFIILSLIRQESAFNPYARSHVGARGLMQLMPNTARQYKKFKSSHILFNPKLNIHLGTKYLKKLIRKFNGNLIYALAAYNAGEGNVSKWKRKDVFKSDDSLINIEMIPFKETRKYVKLIYRNVYFYNLLERNKKFFDQNIEESLQVSFNYN